MNPVGIWQRGDKFVVREIVERVLDAEELLRELHKLRQSREDFQKKIEEGPKQLEEFSGYVKMIERFESSAQRLRDAQLAEVKVQLRNFNNEKERKEKLND